MILIADVRPDEPALEAHSCGSSVGSGPVGHGMCARFPVRVLVPLDFARVDEVQPTPGVMRAREARTGLGRRPTVLGLAPSGVPTAVARWEMPAGRASALVYEIGIACALDEPVSMMVGLPGGPASVRAGEVLEVSVVSATEQRPGAVSWVVSKSEE